MATGTLTSPFFIASSSLPPSVSSCEVVDFLIIDRVYSRGGRGGGVGDRDEEFCLFCVAALEACVAVMELCFSC